jgi:hypothetical protein
MAMLRSSIGEYRPRTFQSQVRFILRIDLCCETFAIVKYAPMFIFVGECPTIGGF